MNGLLKYAEEEGDEQSDGPGAIAGTGAAVGGLMGGAGKAGLSHLQGNDVSKTLAEGAKGALGGSAIGGLSGMAVAGKASSDDYTKTLGTNPIEQKQRELHPLKTDQYHPLID